LELISLIKRKVLKMVTLIQLNKVLQRISLILKEVNNKRLPVVKNKVWAVPSLVRVNAQAHIIMDPAELLMAKTLSILLVRNLEMVTLLAPPASLQVHLRMEARMMTKINHQAKVILRVVLLPMKKNIKAIPNRNSNRPFPTKSIIKHTVLILPMAILVNMVPHRETMLVQMLVTIHIRE
jgi:hypothetical protein